MNQFKKGYDPTKAKDVTDAAMTIRIAYDLTSPFYKMVDCKAFWESDPAFKVKVMGELPEHIVEHCNQLYREGDL